MLAVSCVTFFGTPDYDFSWLNDTTERQKSLSGLQDEDEVNSVLTEAGEKSWHAWAENLLNLDYIQKQIEKIYDDFTGLVSEGRSMPKDSVDAIGQGRVWSGADALNIGLVDTLGGLYDAINYAAARVGLTKADYQLSRYPVVKEVSLLKMLSGNTPDDPEENLTTRVENQPSLSDMFPAIVRMRELRSPALMLRMESVMEIK